MKLLSPTTLSLLTLATPLLAFPSPEAAPKHPSISDEWWNEPLAYLKDEMTTSPCMRRCIHITTKYASPWEKTLKDLCKSDLMASKWFWQAIRGCSRQECASNPDEMEREDQTTLELREFFETYCGYEPQDSND